MQFLQPAGVRVPHLASSQSDGLACTIQGQGEPFLCLVLSFVAFSLIPALLAKGFQGVMRVDKICLVGVNSNHGHEHAPRLV